MDRLCNLPDITSQLRITIMIRDHLEMYSQRPSVSLRPQGRVVDVIMAPHNYAYLGSYYVKLRVIRLNYA
jgi:hypothetical protein